VEFGPDKDQIAWEILFPVIIELLVLIGVNKIELKICLFYGSIIFIL